jgi:16S rRNA (adenine1518-N6/adenine1519-N6)-dimethyltransferase
MTQRLEIPRSAARAAGFHTKKGLGQHLLRDASVVQAAIAALAPGPGDAILEIGPGLGAMTEHLLALGLPVLAVELDAKACAVLKQRFSACANLELVQANVLDCDLPALVKKSFGGRAFHVAANLPYYITTPILAQVLEGGLAFTRMACLCQWEVGARLQARPGTKDYSALTLMAQARADVRILRKVLPGAFTPPPKVDSALVLFERLPGLRVAAKDPALLFRVIRTGFGKRRKTLRNSLLMAPGEPWSQQRVDAALLGSGIDGGRRAETLGLEEFARLSDAMAPVD